MTVQFFRNFYEVGIIQRSHQKMESVESSEIVIFAGFCVIAWRIITFDDEQKQIPFLFVPICFTSSNNTTRNNSTIFSKFP